MQSVYEFIQLSDNNRLIFATLQDQDNYIKLSSFSYYEQERNTTFLGLQKHDRFVLLPITARSTGLLETGIGSTPN